MLAYVLPPAAAMMLTVVAGYFRWTDSSAREYSSFAIESMQAASETATAMLSYEPETAERDLTAVASGLTGDFKDSYSSLVNDVVIPGARQSRISSVATVAGTASVSASPRRAVVLLFVNQTVTVQDEPPSDMASRLRIALDNVDGRWLISEFDPI